jgi:hypothetical protein
VQLYRVNYVLSLLVLELRGAKSSTSLKMLSRIFARGGTHFLGADRSARIVNDFMAFEIRKALPISTLLDKLAPHFLLSGQISGLDWQSLTFNINPGRKELSNGISTLQNQKRGSAHP